MSNVPFAVIALLGATLPSALAGQPPTDLVQAASLRDRAIVTGDAAQWVRLTAAEFTVVDQDGQLRTREEQAAQFVAPNPVPGEPLVYVDGIRILTGRERGEVAACADANFVVSADGMAAARRCRTEVGEKVEVWRRTGSGWVALAAEYTARS